MMIPKERRKVLCVRPGLNPAASSLMMDVIDNWVHALALHCDLEIIEDDFDLKDVCDRVRPDFILFEAVTWCRPRRLRITRAREYPHIPRALNLNCDPHEPMRPITFQMLNEWGVNTLFSYAGMHFRQMHELQMAGVECFSIRGTIDENVFHEYDEEKTIPVCILSAHLFPDFYPWRAKLTQEIQYVFPTYLDLHPGYANTTVPNPFSVRRDKYARQIARSWFAVADTTRLDYAVGKHLEIPAVGTVLIAPDSEVLKEYGLVDGHNCILGSGEELYTKMLDVANDPAKYAAMRQRGLELVQGHYTRQKWTDIIDWFECHTQRKPGQVTRRMGLFGPFQNVPERRSPLSIDNYVRRDNPMGVVLRFAQEAILDGDELDTVSEELVAASKWVGHIAEPRFLLGIVALLQGNIDQAILLISLRGNAQGSVDPSRGTLDPCELAWLLLIATMIGDTELQNILLRQSESLPHVAVRRVQWLIAGPLNEDRAVHPSIEQPMPGDCISIHWLGQESLMQWFDLIARVLAANNREDQALAVELYAKLLSAREYA